MKYKSITLTIALAVYLLAGACDNTYFHDTGLADGNHDCTLWEYLTTDGYNWDSLRVAIDHAGLRDLFEGRDPEHPQITFFGITNHSVNQYLFKTPGAGSRYLYNEIREMPVELCRRMILDHVIDGRHLKSSFGYEVLGTLTGGTELTTLSGVRLRVYRTKNAWNGIPDIGPEELALHAPESGQMAGVASADIVTTTGIVHSLRYSYQWTTW